MPSSIPTAAPHLATQLQLDQALRNLGSTTARLRAIRFPKDRTITSARGHFAQALIELEKAKG